MAGARARPRRFSSVPSPGAAAMVTGRGESGAAAKSGVVEVAEAALSERPRRSRRRARPRRRPQKSGVGACAPPENRDAAPSTSTPTCWIEPWAAVAKPAPGLGAHTLVQGVEALVVDRARSTRRRVAAPMSSSAVEAADRRRRRPPLTPRRWPRRHPQMSVPRPERRRPRDRIIASPMQSRMCAPRRRRLQSSWFSRANAKHLRRSSANGASGCARRSPKPWRARIGVSRRAHEHARRGAARAWVRGSAKHDAARARLAQAKRRAIARVTTRSPGIVDGDQRRASSRCDAKRTAWSSSRNASNEASAASRAHGGFVLPRGKKRAFEMGETITLLTEDGEVDACVGAKRCRTHPGVVLSYAQACPAIERITREIEATDDAERPALHSEAERHLEECRQHRSPRAARDFEPSSGRGERRRPFWAPL